MILFKLNRFGDTFTGRETNKISFEFLVRVPNGLITGADRTV